jgi:hypothetical protein
MFSGGRHWGFAHALPPVFTGVAASIGAEAGATAPAGAEQCAQLAVAAANDQHPRCGEIDGLVVLGGQRIGSADAGPQLADAACLRS